MARRVFFSFHYGNDVWRANQIRKLGVVVGQAAAGFQDASLWEEAKTKGDAAVKKLINEGLEHTTVTVVLIGSRTRTRKWVDYEIKASEDRDNGLLGIYIHSLKDQFGQISAKGEPPKRLVDGGYPIYNWDRAKFSDRVEAAAKAAGH